MNQQIPENWIKVKFKELAKEKSVRVDNPGESGYEKYVGLEHLDSGELVVNRYGSTSDVTSTMKLFEKDDILFARRNTYLRRVSVAPFDGVCSGDIIVLKPVLRYIVKGFLPIFMQFQPFENRIIALSAGAFSKRIKWKQLAEEEIVIPPIEEQKKIVETIWSIQDNLKKCEEFLNIIEKTRLGLLNELYSKGINHKKYRKSELGDIPDEWETVKIKDVFDVQTGTTPSTKIKEYWDSDDINWFTPLDLGKLGHIKKLDQSNRMISLKGLTETNLSLLPKDSILISTRAPVGYVGLVSKECTFNQGCKGLIQKSNTTDPIFYLNYIIYSKERLESFSGGSTFKELSKKDLENFKIVLPPYNEQKQIGKIFQEIDEHKLKTKNHFDQLNELKRKLTDDFLSGNLKIPQEALQNVQ